jgi:hypothetical protein
MTIKATYIAKKDSLGFETGKEYILEVGLSVFSRETIIFCRENNLRAKYGTLKAFLLNFDNISIIKK